MTRKRPSVGGGTPGLAGSSEHKHDRSARRSSASGAGPSTPATSRFLPSSSQNPHRYELGSLVEAADGSNNWFKAKVADIDENGQNPRVRIHFLNWSKIFDEWIPMSSPRLRPLAKEAVEEHLKKVKTLHTPVGGVFKPDEVVQALWLNKKRYPAKIMSIEQQSSDPEEVKYRVRFHDGFILDVFGKDIRPMDPEKAKKIVFSEVAILREEKKFLYDDSKVEEVSSREERRQRTKKLDFKEILGKRKRTSEGPPSESASPVPSANASGSVERPEPSQPSPAVKARTPQARAIVGEVTGKRGVKRPQRYLSSSPLQASPAVEASAVPSPSTRPMKKQKVSRRSTGRKVPQPAADEQPTLVELKGPQYEPVQEPPPPEMEESNVQHVEEAPMSEDSQDESEIEEIETPRVDEERDMDTSEAEEESPADEHFETPAVMPVEVLSEESEDEHRGEEVEQAVAELSGSEGEDVDSEVAGSAAEAVDAEVSGSEAEAVDAEVAESEPEAVDSEVSEAEAADSESSEAEEAEAASSEMHEVDEETAETTEDEGEKEEEAPPADVHEPSSQEMELTALHEPEAEFDEEEPFSAEEEPNVLNDSMEEPFPSEEEPNVLNDSLEEPFPAEEEPNVLNDSLEEPFPAEEEPNGFNDSLYTVEEYRADDEGSATDQESASVDEEVDVEIIKEVFADEAQSASEDSTASSEEENETTDAEEELTREAEDDLSFMPAPGPPGAKTVGKPSLPVPSTAMEMVEEKEAALLVTDAQTAKASQKVSHPSVLVTLRPPSLPIVSDKAKQSPATVLKTPIAKVWQSPRERKPSLKVALAQESSPAAAAAQQGRRSKVPLTTPPASAPAPPLAAHADLTPIATSSSSIFEQPPDEVLYEHCCPLQKCRKIFRRPHLLQMHIKHYHPEYEHLLSVTSVIAMAQNRTDGVDAPSVASPMVKQTAGVSSPLPVDDSKTLKETIAELEARKALESEGQPEAFAEPEVEAMPSPAIKQDNSLTPTVTDNSGRKKKKKKSRLTGSRRSKKRTSAASAAVVATPEVAFVEPEVPMEVVEEAVPEEEVPPVVQEVSQPEVEEPPAAMPAPPPIVPMVLRTNKKKGAGFWAVQQEDQRQKSSTSSAPLAISAPPPIPAITAPPPLPAITAAKQVAGAGLPTPPQSRSGGSSNHFADDVSSSDAWGEDSAVETDGGTAAEQPAAAAFDIICCSCRSTENEGLMIQCDTCLTWQHGTCEQLDETALPDKYECTTCRNPRLQRPSMKFMHDQKYLKTGVLPKPAVLEDLDAGEKESIVARKRLHELFAHIMNIQDMFPSLEHKINIARNINHPKLVQWAKPWTTSTPAAAVVQQASTSTAASAAAGTADSAPELSYDEVRRIASLLESTLLRTNPAAVAEGTSAGIAAVGEAIASVAGIAREASIGHDGAGVHAEHPHGAELALVSDLAEWIADGSAAVGPSLVDVVQPPIPVFKAPELKRIEPQECQANLIAHVEDVQKNLEDELNRMSEVLDDVEKKLNAPNLKPETRHALMNFLSKFFPKAVSHADAE